MRTIILAATLSLTLQAGAQTTLTPAQRNASQPTAKQSSRATHHEPEFRLVLESVPTITPAPFSQNPIQRLRGTASAILIFAPDTTTPALLMQFALLERNELALTEHDAILVPNITQHHTTDEAFPGENISPGTDGDQLSARLKFNVNPSDFAIIVLDKDGTVKFRSSTPVTVASIGARLDSPSRPGE
jgi:hypothetical protein